MPGIGRRFPEALELELRRTMCRDTYRRVEQIMDRWLEVPSSTRVVSGLDQLMARTPEHEADLMQARERVALATLGRLIVDEGRERGVLAVSEGLRAEQDTAVTLYQVLLVRQEPRQ